MLGAYVLMLVSTWEPIPLAILTWFHQLTSVATNAKGAKTASFLQLWQTPLLLPLTVSFTMTQQASQCAHPPTTPVLL